MEATKRDYADRLSSSQKRKRDPQLELAMGSKLEVVEHLGKLLMGGGYRRPAQLVAEVSLSQRFVDLANRCLLGTTTASDTGILEQLRVAKVHLNIGGKDRTLLELLSAFAKAIGMKLEREKKKETLPNGTRRELVQWMKLVRLLPEDVGNAWLVWSDVLATKVRVDSWVSAHANVQLDSLDAALSNDPDYGDLFTRVYEGADSGDARWEKINAKELEAALTHRRHIRNTSVGQALTDAVERALQELHVLEAIDREAEPADEHGVRRLHVIYGKRSGLGRRTASYPSMQACSSSLRPLLLKLIYHDVDIVNCHPALMIHVTRIMGHTDAEIPTLLRYVADRHAVLQRIANHFEVHLKPAKFAVLRVLNGGSVEQWCKDVGLPAGIDTNQPDLRDLAEEARVIRNAFFAMTEQKHTGSIARLRELVRSRKGPETSNVAIDRAVFSHCIFEAEDAVLATIDEHFRSPANGWTVASLIYDGMHVEHRNGDTQHAETGRWTQLEGVMRGAEAVVLRKLGYKIELKEKALFEGSN